MATPARPQTVEQYLHWASTTLGVDFASGAARNRYETNVQNALNTVQNSRFMRELPAFLSSQEEAYKRTTGAPLLMDSELTVLRKPFDSAVIKSYRLNILRNNRFPNPPGAEWITPENWYARFDDLVRGTLVCKFLDGPKLLGPALDAYAASLALSGRHVSRSTDDGYYAFHHYTRFPVEIVDAAWQSQAFTIELEIQLTTQLQEVLRELTHPLYEEARVATGRRDDAWKWDYDSPKFRTSYLGHTLHMIEAVIVQVRDSTKAGLVENVPQAEAVEPQKVPTPDPAAVETQQ